MLARCSIDAHKLVKQTLCHILQTQILDKQDNATLMQVRVWYLALSQDNATLKQGRVWYLALTWGKGTKCKHYAIPLSCSIAGLIELVIRGCVVMATQW